MSGNEKVGVVKIHDPVYIYPRHYHEGDTFCCLFDT